MSQITEDVRIGLPLHDFQGFWEEHRDEITAATGSEETPDGGTQWTRAGIHGRLQPTALDGSTLLRITIEADDPRTELDRLLNRLSQALDESGDVTGASFAIEPSAGVAPDEETSPDQPL